jgi:hypothetical protein
MRTPLVYFILGAIAAYCLVILAIMWFFGLLGLIALSILLFIVAAIRGTKQSWLK